MALTADDVRPTVDEVALIALRTRTVGHAPAYGGLGADTGPEDVTTFTDTTRPTVTEVDQIVDSAQAYMLARLDQPVSDVPDYHAGAIRHATALYTAVLIETSYYRETVNQALVDMWRSLIGDTLTAITGAAPGEQVYTFGTLTIGTTLTEGPNWVELEDGSGTVPVNADFMPGLDDVDPYQQPITVALGRPPHNQG